VDRFLDQRSNHWSGAASPGRDIYARVAYGSRLSLIVGLPASALAVGAGLVLGALSGFYRGLLDLGLQRPMDALQAFPAIVLLLVLVQVTEPSVRNTVLAMAAIGTPITTRCAIGTLGRVHGVAG
jgi:peptide/nickel transport system permease protein